MKQMNQEQMAMIVDLFSNFITTISRRKTGSWKAKPLSGNQEGKGIIVSCDNGTRNFIHDIPVSIGVLSIFNSKNNDLKLKEVERFCIEDDDTHTKICWILYYVD